MNKKSILFLAMVASVVIALPACRKKQVEQVKETKEVKVRKEVIEE